MPRLQNFWKLRARVTAPSRPNRLSGSRGYTETGSTICWRAACAELTPDLPAHLATQTAYAVDQEMAVCLDDVVLRRLTEGQTGEIDEAQIAAIAEYMSKRLNWSDAEKKRQIKTLKAGLHIA